MRRQFLLASVGAVALTASAAAAELPPPAPPAPIFTWTGLYVGLQIGYAWDYDPTTLIAQNPATFAVFNNSVTVDSNGVIGGAHLGYNLQIGQLVAGLEGTVDGTTINETTGNTAVLAVQTKEQVQGSIRLRLGYALDRVLLYATGGAAFTGINNTYFAGGALIAGFPGAFQEEISRTRSGWTVGGGIEYAITNNWSIRAEYRYSDFGRYEDYPFAIGVPLGGTLFVEHHLTENQVQLGVSYKFDSSALAPVVARY
jgi:outer membrane immunogenic protein